MSFQQLSFFGPSNLSIVCSENFLPLNLLAASWSFYQLQSLNVEFVSPYPKKAGSNVSYIKEIRLILAQIIKMMKNCQKDMFDQVI